MQDRQSLTSAEWNERIIEQSRAVGPVGRGDPEKSLEKLAHGALRQIAGDENKTGAMVLIRPAFKPCGRVKNVLHAVHDDRRVRHLRELHNAFDAQKLFAMRSAQQLEKHLKCSGGDGVVGGENERGGVMVVVMGLEGRGVMGDSLFVVR